MSEHENIKFRAASAASTTAVFCDDWDDITQTGFDTVRDTMRNYSFSSKEEFTSNPQFAEAHVSDPDITSITWTADGNLSPIDNASPVITLAEHPYYSTSLSPGIEWVTATLTYKDPETGETATGSRRLRLIPTSVIETGGDKRVDVFLDGDGNETTPYDHKEGFATTYLDATTLQDYLTGKEEPDGSLKTFADVANQQYSNGVITGDVDLSFNSSTKNLSVTATMTNAETGEAAHIENLYEKLNNTKKFEAADCGMYNITYKASLSDGRYLSIGKKLVVVGPWSVVYNYNYDGLLAGEKISPDSIFHIQSNLVDFENFTFEDYDTPPARDGWQFSYWSLDKEGHEPVDQTWFDSYEERAGTLVENIDVYAQWKKLSPAVVSTVSIEPREGHIDGLGTGETISASGAAGDTYVFDDALPPNSTYAFSRWVIEGKEDAAAAQARLMRSNTGKWVYEFTDEDEVIYAEYVPLFEDTGLTVKAKKILNFDELEEGQFTFGLIPFPDVLRDPVKAVLDTPSGDGIDDRYQAIVTFNIVNGYFEDGSGERKSTWSEIMTIRDMNGELLPEEERTITADSPYRPPTIAANDGYGNGHWEGTSLEDLPIWRDATFTYKFETLSPDPVDPIPPDGPEIPDNQASYVIEWYDTYGRMIKSPETRTGTTGNTIKATDSDKKVEGYVFDTWNSNNITSATCSASGTVLRLYFRVDEFTVIYTDGVSGTTLFPDQGYAELRVGDSTPPFTQDEQFESYVDNNGNVIPLRDGFVFMGWAPTVNPKISIDDADENNMIFYTATWSKASPTLVSYSQAVMQNQQRLSLISPGSLTLKVTTASNDASGNISFGELDLKTNGTISGEVDGITYFYFWLQEQDSGDGSIIYDKTRYFVQIEAAAYENRYVPIRINYYKPTSDGGLSAISEDDVIFENTKIWIEMPDTGKQEMTIVISISVLFLIIGMATIIHTLRRKREL